MFKIRLAWKKKSPFHTITEDTTQINSQLSDFTSSNYDIFDKFKLNENDGSRKLFKIDSFHSSDASVSGHTSKSKLLHEIHPKIGQFRDSQIDVIYKDQTTDSNNLYKLPELSTQTNTVDYTIESSTPKTFKNYKDIYSTENLLFMPKFAKTFMIPKLPAASHHFCSREQTPPEDIFFLKTHKTGSSSVQNILFRLGEKHQLDFAFPKIGNFFNYPQPMHVNMIKQPVLSSSGSTSPKIYNIFALHCRFSDNILTQYNQHFKFTILRNPETLLKSAFNYFPHSTPINRAHHDFTQFITNPSKFYVKPMKYSWWSKNLMLFDLGQEDGFVSHKLDSLDNIVTAVKKIDSIFDLVMILEHFDESLLLLKKLLCLEMEDIVYIASNQAKMVQNQAEAENDPEANKIRNSRVHTWAKADYKLHQHFNATLWKMLDFHYNFATGGYEKLQQEKTQLQDMIQATKSLCFTGQSFDPVQAKKFGVWQPRPEVKISYWLVRNEMLANETCRNLARVETRYIKKLYEQQFQAPWIGGSKRHHLWEFLSWEVNKNLCVILFIVFEILTE